MPIIPKPFQLTAARRRLELNLLTVLPLVLVSTHSRPKAAGDFRVAARRRHMVSTHSRPKAAGPANGLLFTALKSFQLTAARRQLETYLVPNLPLELRFNSQPPEGSWAAFFAAAMWACSFNSQPPEGGWLFYKSKQTAKRRFNSQPPEGGWWHSPKLILHRKSFNSQPPEGGWLIYLHDARTERVSTHSRPKAAGRPVNPPTPE